MRIKPPRSSGLRFLSAAICVAGLAALSIGAHAADDSAAQVNTEAITAQETKQKKAQARGVKRHGCEPITKACFRQSTPPRQAVAEAKPPTPASARNRCEPITKACIYRPATPGRATVTKKEAPVPASKRNRCEPITKACIYR